MTTHQIESKSGKRPTIRQFFGTRRGSVYQAALLLSLPAILGIVLFYYLPIIQAVRYSFYNYNLIADTFTWLGADNYTRMLTDKLVQKSFTVTGLYFILKVPLLMASGLGLAILVRHAWRGVGAMRTIILLPTVTSMVVVTVVWGFMYHPTSGLINSMLNSVGLPSQDFLTSPTQALPSIVALTIWKDVGLVMLFYLAGLMGISETLYEAARIDGANGWQQFRHITFPSLRGTHIFVLVTSTVAAFKVFVPVFMTTQGGPVNSTKVILVSIYDYAFRFNQMGYAAAISVILALILLVVSLFQFVLTRERKSSGKSAFSRKKVPLI